MSWYTEAKAWLEEVKERQAKLGDGPLTAHQVEVVKLIDQDLPRLIKYAEDYIEENR